MANEAIVMQGEASPNWITYYTVADATAITKGTIMRLSTAATRTAIAHDGTKGYLPVGLAVSEKEANDGQTEMGVQRKGLAYLTAKGTIDEGDVLFCGITANQVEPAAALATSILDPRLVIGVALQAATAGNRFLARICPMC